MIQINKNPVGKFNNITFGMCQLLDGTVRILSLGFLHSSFTLEHARRTAKNRLQLLKKQHKG